MRAPNRTEDETLLFAVKQAANRFPFACLEVYAIVAETGLNVIAHIGLDVTGVEQDYVVKTSLQPERSYVLHQVWASESQRELEKDLAPFVFPMTFVWGHGIGGAPAPISLQPYLKGRTLKDWTISELAQANPRLLQQLSHLCRKIILRFLRTGAIIDTSGSHVASTSWVKHRLKNIWWNFSFYNTTNVLIEDKTNRVFLVDTVAPKALLGLRQARGPKRKAKILVMFIGVVLSKLLFDTVRMVQLMLVASGCLDSSESQDRGPDAEGFEPSE